MPYSKRKDLNGRLMSISQLADKYDLTERSIQRWTSERQIAHFKPGGGKLYIDEETFLAFLTRNYIAKKQGANPKDKAIDGIDKTIIESEEGNYLVIDETPRDETGQIKYIKDLEMPSKIKQKYYRKDIFLAKKMNPNDRNKYL